MFKYDIAPESECLGIQADQINSATGKTVKFAGFISVNNCSFLLDNFDLKVDFVFSWLD